MDGVKTAVEPLLREEFDGYPDYWSNGTRHEGGVNLDQAFVRNVRTCRPDAKGDARVAKSARARVPIQGTGAERLVVGMKVP
jgi:hypothetical protein